MVKAGKNEAPLFVIYDVRSDRIRKKVFDACEDYGLAAVQFSAFFGWLDRPRRTMLCDRLRALMKNEEGSFVVIPLEARQLAGVTAVGDVLSIHQHPMVRFL